MTMLENAARAIIGELYPMLVPKQPSPYDAASNRQRQVALGVARDVIAAIRDADEGVIDAASCYPGPVTREGIAANWQAMIDKILEDEK